MCSIHAHVPGMRFTVEPSPSGGFHVRLLGSDAPLSRHDTEEEAEARRQAYERGAGEPRGELVDLPDGSEVLVRPVRPEDEPLFALRRRSTPRTGRGAGRGALHAQPRAPGLRRGRRHGDRRVAGARLGWRAAAAFCRHAAANGVRTFTASRLTGNRSMLALFERSGPWRRAGSTVA